MEIDPEVIIEISNQLHEIGAEPFFLCISGSDNYGFSSENNSDVDIRGAYIHVRPDDIFNPHLERKLTIEGECYIDDLKHEWQIHEVAKFLRLLGKSNMNILDWIHSNDILSEPPDHYGISLEDLRNKSSKFIDQRFIRHTFGWTKHMYNKSWRDPKKILHTLRPLMTCLYYLDTGVYQPNIQLLTSEQSLGKYRPLIMELIELKKIGQTSNDAIRQSSLDTYDELKESIEERKDVLPELLSRDEDIRSIITYIRLNSLNHRIKTRIERPSILA